MTLYFALCWFGCFILMPRSTELQ